MSHLFEYLDRHGYNDPPNVMSSFLDKLSLKEVIEILEKLYLSTELDAKNTKPVEGSLFNFSAPSRICGGLQSCSEVQCRIEKAYNFSLFNVLYADGCLIPNLFDYYYQEMFHSDNAFNFENLTQEMFFRNRIVGDILVYQQMRLLIEKGIINIVPTIHMVCEGCKKNKLLEDKKISNMLDKLKDTMAKKLLKKLGVILDSSRSVIISANDDSYIEHGVMFLKYGILPEILQKRIRAIPYNLTRKEIVDIGITDYILDNVLDDLLMQKWNPYMDRRYTYLTNNILDAEIIAIVNKERNPQYTTNLVTGLTHSIPFLQDVSIKMVMEIREKDGESFNQYRYAVGKAIRETSNSHTNQEFATALHDIIVPELNKIDLTLKAHTKKKRGNYIFPLATASLGVMGYFMKEINLVTGALLAVNTLKDIHINMKNNALSNREDSDYYFLWQVKKSHEQK